MDWNRDKPLNGVRSLLATDKQLTKEILVAALRYAGAGQIMAGSGPEMLEAVRAFKPDVIFAEFDMNPLDGNAFFSHIRFDFKLNIPAILLFHEEDQKKAMVGARQAGLNGALPIPFTRDAVVGMTRKVLGARS
ncbi:MAG: response regulator [Rhodospirillaceae bacterium]|nr:response regulator [Rhodospirillales bacterium]